jgi:uncharacterized protein YegL
MTNQNLTHIAVIADRSGSMYSIADDMNNGLQAFLKEQADLPGDLTIDITTFDSVVETPYQDADFNQISFPIIYPRGSTSLLDAIGITVTSLGERLADKDEDDRPGKVLVVVVTDGAENTSKEYAADQIKAMVEHQQEEYDWGFVFLGANIDAFSVGGGLGFRADATMNYVANSSGTASMLRSVSNVAASYRGGEALAFTDEDRKDAVQ